MMLCLCESERLAIVLLMVRLADVDVLCFAAAEGESLILKKETKCLMTFDCPR